MEFQSDFCIIVCAGFDILFRLRQGRYFNVTLIAMNIGT